MIGSVGNITGFAFAYEESYTGGVNVSSAFDPEPVAPYNGNRDDVLTFRATGADLSATLFPRDIDPPS